MRANEVANHSHRRYLTHGEVANYSQSSRQGRGGRDVMYICLCNALTDRDLRPHTLDGNASVSMVYRACGCQPQCGKCVPFVREMLREGLEGSTAGQFGGAD